jgi:glycoside hydrolase-like protein
MSATALAAATMAPAHHAASIGTKMIDFAERQVSVDQIAAAGYAGVIVYVSQVRPGATFNFKPAPRSYTDALRAAGLHVASVYQHGKPGWIDSPSDFTRGFDGGVDDANTALSLHAAAGGPDSAPIFFSVDENVSADTWKSTAS